MNCYSRIQSAVDFMEERLDQQLSIAEIASRALYSPFHFQRLFQAISGCSVQTYLRSRRLSEAAKMLLAQQGRPSVLDIAVASGYGSQEAFTRALPSISGSRPPSTGRSRASSSCSGLWNF